MINGTPLEFGLRVRIIERASELRQKLDDDLAAAIVNKYAEAVNKGQGA